MDQNGVYCSTANSYFSEREQITEHYQSEYHRYNLKRKIAGLPPVTREWYEARKAQLAASSTGSVQRVWFDPLTKKKFYSENTYLAFTKSKKYQDAVKKSGKPAPTAIVTLRKIDQDGSTAAAPQQPSTTTAGEGFTVKPAIKSAATARTSEGAPATTSMSVEEPDADSGSEWETASEEEMDGGTSAAWEEWDPRRSFFDNHMSPTMEENLEYMWKKFGFYLPDAEYLVDPTGLVKYLGAKLSYGHIPLYESGNNPNAKQYASLHGVQRHMIDTGKCKMAYDDNEEEYEDFYDYGEDDDENEQQQGMDVDGRPRNTTTTLAVGNVDLLEASLGGYELALPSAKGGVKLLGSREFARYYKQKHRLGDTRGSTAAARVLAEYRRLSVPLLGDGSGGETVVERKRAQKTIQRAEKMRIANSIQRNINDNLPKNVPY